MSRYLKTLFPITLVILLVGALFTFRGEAQSPNPKSASGGAAPPLKPVTGVAVAFAESDAVRDMPDVEASMLNNFNEAEDVERNPDNVAVAAWKSAHGPSAAVRNLIPSFDAVLNGNGNGNGKGKISAPSPSLPGAPLVTFDGMTAQEGYANFGGSTVAPSDENIAVGPKDVLQTTNTGFRIWDKAGNPRTNSKLIKSLFSKLGGVCGTFERGDPIAQYDRLSGRFVISQFNFADPNKAPFFECFAVSKTSDPTGAYYTYAFQTSTETPPGVGVGQNFPDYPHIGTWPDGYYMTVNQFDRSLPAGSQFNGTGVYAFNRQKMLVGDPTATYVFFNLNLASHGEGIGSMQPTDFDGMDAPVAGSPNVFAYAISDEYESAPFNVDALRLFNFHVDFSAAPAPGTSSFTERAESPLAMAAYDARSPENNGITRAECEQPPPAAAGDGLNAIAYRTMFRLEYRRFVNSNTENLTSSITVNTSGVNPNSAATYQAGVRYFQLRKSASNPANLFTVFDQGTFSPDAGNPTTGTNRFLPSAAIDNQGNLAVSYSTSSTTIFPSITYAARDFNAAGIPAAGLSSEQTLFAGTGVQIATGNRWGDYQSLQVDPTDDCTFWTTNQYYNTPGGSQFNWRTRIGSFKFPTCTAPDQGTVAGTVTSCETGAPIAGAIITFTGPNGFSNGFSAATGPDGKFSVQLATGPDATVVGYTATVSAPGRLCTQAGPFSVSMFKNGVTPLDVCLSGTANPIVDTTDPLTVSVSGGNGDGKINPNECNRMTVRLTNTGCATAKFLSATLTSSTPGVTVTPIDSPYPDIAIDGSGTNTIPFRVSTNASVGCQTINFTLTTHFNGGGTTVNNFTVNAACGVAPNQTVSGSLDPADTKNVPGRLGRNSASVCGVPKSCPGVFAGTPGPRSFDQIPFVNGPAPACVTITTTSAGGALLVTSAYNGVYNPADTTLCSGYLGDDAVAVNGSTSFAIDLTPGQTFSVVVMEVNSGTAATPYSVTVSGLSAPAPQGSGPCAAAITTQVSSPTATLGQSISDSATLTTGGSPTGTITFKLFGPNNGTCSGNPIFTSVVGVNGDGTYASQSYTPIATGTYNWIASYSGDANNPAATGACGDANESTAVAAAPTPTATPTATATATATATPTATPAAQTLNLSTRMRTDTGNNVGIGGFTITGAVPKHVLIRAIGPSLTKFGFTAAEVLADPTLEVHGPGAFGTITNNDWRDSQEAQIKADGLTPTNNLESAIDATLPPGAYTAIVAGKTGTPPAGICLFEVYDLDAAATSKLANLSSRAFVGTGNTVVIAGFVLGNNAGNDRVVIRGLGPSLASFGIANTLADPTLELRDENGILILANNDWQDNAVQAADITAAGLAPSDGKESAIAATLPPGLYTAILAGLNGTTGVGTVEVYDRGP